MSRRHRAAIVALAVGAAVGAMGGRALRGGPALAVAPTVVVGLLFVVAGMVARARRPDPVIGRLLILTGLAWLFSDAFTAVPHALPFTVGLALFPLGLAALGHLALVFPSGHPSSRLEKVLVVVPYVLAVVGIPIISVDDCPECPANVVGLDVQQGEGRLAYSAVLVAALVTTVVVLAVLVRRWWAASPVARRVLLPVVPGACLFAAVYIGGVLAELGLPSGLGQRWILLALVLVAAAPIVFLAGLLRARLARANVGGLVVELGEASSAGNLRRSLARALGDPTVDVAYWMEDQAAYVDAEGRRLELPLDDSRRSVTLVEREGRRVGALVYDAALGDDPALVEAVSATVGLALENERLHAEVLARLDDVRASRARIVQAGDAARRQVERDLHDGAQQRLVSLSLALGMARTKLGPQRDAALEGILDQAAEEAALALRELRELAQGLHPAVLSDAGLVAAVESLAERSPVPVELASTADGRRLPPPVEAAAYFIVSESLANVAKHARASSATVRLEPDGDRLRVEVIDDGVGGARVRPGSGLEGLADRVAALDGSFQLESELGTGTRIRVDLPCG